MDIVPSDEQNEIIKLYQDGNNLSVITPAGGAKTTTALMCTLLDPSKRKTLWLTYNRMLKEEIRTKTSTIEWIEAHNFHSFAVKYIDKEAYGDKLSQKLKECNIKLKQKYRILIIDEAQDINPIFYELVLKIIKDCEIKQLVLIGDHRQCIYEFTNSSSKYLLNPENYFKLGPFVEKKTISTYRSTPNITKFVNQHFLDNDRIISRNTNFNEKIDYWITNPYNFGNKIIEYIIKYVINNVMILSASTKSYKKNTPLEICVDYIKTNYKNKYNVYLPSEDIEPDPELSKGKLSILTFHKSKGQERKCVIVFGFNESYYEYFQKNKNEH